MPGLEAAPAGAPACSRTAPIISWATPRMPAYGLNQRGGIDAEGRGGHTRGGRGRGLWRRRLGRGDRFGRKFGEPKALHGDFIALCGGASLGEILAGYLFEVRPVAEDRLQAQFKQ